MRRTNTLLIAISTAGPLFANGPAPLERSMQNMSYTIANQDQEIARLKQKIQNQETILDSMHAEVTQLIKAAKDSQKSSSSQVDSRLKAMEKNIDKLLADLKTFKTHANESSSTFTEIQKKLKEQEEISTLQAKQIKELENALRNLAGVLQSSSGTKASAGEYRVKPGDSLDKIAKDHGTTVDAIKRVNTLSKDTIYPGQKLEIP